MCGAAKEYAKLQESRNDEVESDPFARLDRKDALGQDTSIERESLESRGIRTRTIESLIVNEDDVVTVVQKDDLALLLSDANLGQKVKALVNA